MAQFDPAQRVETWVMQEVQRDASGRRTYRRLGFNLVEYDGSPDMYIEPRPPSDRYDLGLTAIGAVDLLDPITDGRRMKGFEYVEGQRYNGVHRFD